jgi:hypothetical protein
MCWRFTLRFSDTCHTWQTLGAMRFEAKLLRCGYTWLLVTGCHVYHQELVTAPERANATTTQTARDCAKRTELCNGEDDDCDGVIDEDAALDCQLANATARCVSSSCVVDHCAPGFQDCNGVSDDGCEQTEAELDCGQCGRHCDDSPVSVAPGSQEPQPDAQPEQPEQPAQPAQPAAAGVPDAGEARSPVEPCQALAEQCNGRDDDCDGKVDEDVQCACANLLGRDARASNAPTGQGEACDRCACERCPAEVSACFVNADEAWSQHCAVLLQCYGRHSNDARCAAGDCYQNGAGPCANEIRNAVPGSDGDVRNLLFGISLACTAPRVTTACGAATALHYSCLKTTCASVCKF